MLESWESMVGKWEEDSSRSYQFSKQTQMENESHVEILHREDEYMNPDCLRCDLTKKADYLMLRKF